MTDPSDVPPPRWKARFATAVFLANKEIDFPTALKIAEQVIVKFGALAPEAAAAEYLLARSQAGG